jgi:hypothetical protein
LRAFTPPNRPACRGSFDLDGLAGHGYLDVLTGSVILWLPGPEGSRAFFLGHAPASNDAGADAKGPKPYAGCSNLLAARTPRRAPHPSG